MPHRKPIARPPAREDRPAADDRSVQQMAADLASRQPAPDPDSPRGRIIAAARQLFADHGLNGTSTRAIADMASVNLAMIHYYFGSKEKLYEYVLGSELLYVVRSVAGGIAGDLPLEELVVQLPLRLMATLRAEPLWARIMRREMADGGDALKRAIHSLGIHGPIGMTERFRAAYQRSVDAGRVRNLSPDAVRECLIGIAYSLVFFGPLISVISGRDINDETVWKEWNETVSTLLRRGLLVENR
jgi:TetR/AcrR family transcriptional regulator